MEVSNFCNTAAASVKSAKESSLKVNGAQLFNIMPRALRDIIVGIPEQFS